VAAAARSGYSFFRRADKELGSGRFKIRLDINNPGLQLQTRVVFQGPAAFASFSC